MNDLPADKRHFRLFIILSIGIMVIITGYVLTQWLDTRQRSGAIEMGKAYFTGQSVEYHASHQGAWEVKMADHSSLRIFMKSTNDGGLSWGNWMIVMAELRDPLNHEPELYLLDRPFDYSLSRVYGDPHHVVFPSAEHVDLRQAHISMGDVPFPRYGMSYELRTQSNAGAVRQRLVALKFIRQDKKLKRRPSPPVP